MNPHYLKDVSKSPLNRGYNGNSTEDVPPVAALDLSVPLHIPTFASSDKYLNENKQSKATKPDKKSNKKMKKKKKKGKKSSDEEEVESETVHVVNTAIEMPEGATMSDGDESALPEDDPHRALNIDLDM
jgi:AP-3 complex subunit delta-1